MTKQLIATISEDITVTGRVQNEVSFFNHVRPFFGIVGLLFLVSASYGEKLPGADPGFLQHRSSRVGYRSSRPATLSAAAPAARWHQFGP